MDRKRPVDTHIGQRLKEYRQLRGMTVRELADAADVTPGQISHYEHGRDRISHERVTEFARILRIKPNDLYQPPGSRLRRNHVRWRLTNFMAAVIAEAAALMSSWRKAAADNEATINEATMVAAVAVAVASAAAASDAGAGNHATKTAWHVSDDGRGGKIAHDSPVSATGKDTSAQSTPASANGDHSASPFKPTVDHHAIVDPGIKLDLIPTDHLLQHPADNLLHIPAQPDDGADPAHPYVDGNQSATADDSNAHPGKVPHDPPAPTALSSDSGKVPHDPPAPTALSSDSGKVPHDPPAPTALSSDSGKVPHDPPAPTALSSDVSADDSAQPFHAVDDPETNSLSNSNIHPLQQPADNSLHTPAQPDDNGSPAVTDGAHLGSGQVDGIESASPKLADDGSTNSGKVAHDPPAPTARSSDVSGNDSAQPFKTNFGQHAVDDPETDSPSNSNNHPLQQPADNSLHTPAQPDDNGSPAVTDGTHLGSGQVDGIDSASPKLADDGSTNSGNASADPDINDQHPADNSIHTRAQPDDGPHPADPPVDVSELPNFKFANNDSGHPDIGPDGAHTAHSQADVDQSDSFKFANNDSGHPDIGPDGAQTAHSQADVDQSDSFKFANNDSAHPGTVVPHDSPALTTLPSDSNGTHGPAAPNLNVPGTVMSDAASDQFVFEKGHDKVADVKPDMIETDHAVADIQHLLHTAHDANAVGALDPNHMTAPQDMTKVQLPHHHGDFHFA